MYVNAGELNKRISIYRKPELDGDGYLPEGAEPVLIHSCWAKFSQTSGTELAKNNADFGEVKVRFLIRHARKVIDRKMIVRYKKLDYEIVYINGYGDGGEYLELWCKRLNVGGGPLAAPPHPSAADAAATVP